MTPFPPDALDANRRGELSDEQRQGFGALSRYRRRSALSSAAFLTAGGLLVAFLAPPTASVVLRSAVEVICLAIAGVLVVRSVTGSDALTQDLRFPQVQSVEGAIGKRRITGGARSGTTHFLDVGDSSFKVALATFAAAPDAGFVRVYFLPHSRKIVNLERLPNAPVTTEVTPHSIVESLGAVLHAHNRRERNEARAGIAGIGETVKAMFAQPSASPSAQPRDARPLADAVVGTWKNVMMTVTFSDGGRVTVQAFGTRREGRWSIDADGRLRSDITGREQTADASIAGDQLTIMADGRALKFAREGTN